jgi:triacylglycerol esterase/lipase EstA (alpha/beta hydrolase family)
MAWVARRLEELSAPPPSPDLSRAQRPVLLLRGLSSPGRALDVLERRLRRDGYDPFRLPPGGLRVALAAPGLDDLALRLREAVERLAGRHPGLGPLAIVAHGVGGLVASHYVKRLGGWRRVGAVVTLGTPYRGTAAAIAALALGPLARVAWQAIPGAPFLRRLGQGPWPGTVRLASIWSRDDGLVPYPSAVLATHGLPHLASVEVDATHRALLTSKRVYEAVRRELAAAAASAPVRRGRLAVMRGGRIRPEADAVDSAPCATGAGTISTTGRSSR